MIRSESLRVIRKLVALIALLACLAFVQSDFALKKAYAASCCGDCAAFFQYCMNICSCCGCQGGIGQCSARYSACINSCGGCP
jgi:hypothetical protein